MNESLEAIAMVQGHSGQRINLLSVHSPFFSEKFRVRQSSFPRDETYGLTTQLRRSASSIPSNIAEGCGREGDAELARFCLIARGSASELEYQILLAHDLKLIPSGRYEELSQEITEIKRMKDKRNKRACRRYQAGRLAGFLAGLRRRITRFMLPCGESCPGLRIFSGRPDSRTNCLRAIACRRSMAPSPSARGLSR